MSRLISMLFTAVLISACSGAPTETKGDVEPADSVESASCSGDVCGCYSPTCGEECAPAGPGFEGCMVACRHAQKQCAIECCGVY